eukprot:TRINITY_DN1285_c0_g1_i10.p1 TRINITY_DN1285_c0_g1~~TRINITY_DN1285_c0_g1_i10.p1  ORF type:complete len:1678 (-),score=494.91 TRINITY_DN1285_c0_g1_i10:1974-6923(-)
MEEEIESKRASLLSGDGDSSGGYKWREKRVSGGGGRSGPNRFPRARSHGGLKLSEIQNHELLEYARKTWGSPKDSVFDVEVINHMYGEMLKATPEMRMLLEYSRYLENYLWVHFEDGRASKEYLMSIVWMVNEKRREGVPKWAWIVEPKVVEEEGKDDVDDSRSAVDHTVDQETGKRKEKEHKKTKGGKKNQKKSSKKTKLQILFSHLFRLASNGFVSDVSAEDKKEERDESLVEVDGARDGDIECDENEVLTLEERTVLWMFFVNCFESLEVFDIQREVLRLISVPIWFHLNSRRREFEMKDASSRLLRAYDKTSGKATLERDFFFHSLVDFVFFVRKHMSSSVGISSRARVRYCERYLEFLVCISSALSLRRFALALIDDMRIVPICRASKLVNLSVCRRLLIQLDSYVHFEIDASSGEALSDEEIMEKELQKRLSFQRLAFKYFPSELLELSLGPARNVSNRDILRENLERLSFEQFVDLCDYLRIISKDELFGDDSREEEEPQNEQGNDGGKSALLSSSSSKMVQSYGLNMRVKDVCSCSVLLGNDMALLTDVFLSIFESRPSQYERIRGLPLYPDESLLFNEDEIPSDTGDSISDEVFPFPKLGVQYLTFHDYLMRNFSLYRAESAHQIKEDVRKSVERLIARRDASGGTIFRGWSRMSVPLEYFTITRIGKPNVGEDTPNEVIGELEFSLHKIGKHVRSEWDMLRCFDVVFLICVEAVAEVGESWSGGEMFRIRHIRGAEIIDIGDDRGHTRTGLLPFEDDETRLSGTRRIMHVRLDPSQYAHDVMDEKEGRVYSSFNVLVRRKQKENNFKAVLDAVRSAVTQRDILPMWLRDTYLGYGDPRSSSCWNLDENEHHRRRGFDMADTFLDKDHVFESFPLARSVNVKEGCVQPPFLLRVKYDDDGGIDTVECESVDGGHGGHGGTRHGPFAWNEARHNSVRFTALQIEAILSGMQNGLTLIVGPPGTGKTDVAVQIISNIYHNFPGERTLLLTHSNHALNDLFEKIMERDIDERHLVRLGHGEKDLRTDKDFSRHGRVNYVLSRRLELLGIVQKLGRSFDSSLGDVGSNCETARTFYVLHVRDLLNDFKEQISSFHSIRRGEDCDESFIRKHFPFPDFFESEGVEWWRESVSLDCVHYLESIFSELKEYQPFELLRNMSRRADYLMTRSARVVAMTCTHAALKRKDLLKLGFSFDNIVMEESGQMLEIEALIPLMTRRPESRVSFGSRAGGGDLGGKEEAHARQSYGLKRMVLIGDHEQLPPVVKNMVFQKYCGMDQSLFSRFIRLNVPHVQLSHQGRMRSGLAELFRWRYPGLCDLSDVQNQPRFQKGNTGFAHPFQFINVEDYDGRGEEQPHPYYYQNLGEAEYVVATYMYMRLLGYPSAKISIITMYNGQKHLIRDVLSHRCAGHPLFGLPRRISTVDKFQGQQNDYILLSMVRTSSVGHVRDVRRLVVGLSRARLGLYIFGRFRLFRDCVELLPAMEILSGFPQDLMLSLNEVFPTDRSLDESGTSFRVASVEHMGSIVDQMTRQRIESEGLVVDRPTSSRVDDKDGGDIRDIGDIVEDVVDERNGKEEEGEDGRKDGNGEEIVIETAEETVDIPEKDEANEMEMMMEVDGADVDPTEAIDELHALADLAAAQSEDRQKLS